MFALVYASRATATFDEAAIAQLADKASKKNERLKVTGFLNYRPERGSFFQFLEGPEQAVLALMCDIENDSRHQVLTLLHLGQTDKRFFPTWNMRYLSTGYFHLIEMEDVLEDVLSAMHEKDFDRAAVSSAVLRLSRLMAGRKNA